MGHYAKVVNDTVVDIIVAEKEFIDTLPDKWAWVETSYNIRGGVYYNPETGLPHEDQSLATATAGRKRKNYPMIGYRYDIKRDAFISPTPYPSWILNEKTCLWEAPIPYPDMTKQFIWNDINGEWVYTGYYLDSEGNLLRE
jgi:hypothetical protein